MGVKCSAYAVSVTRLAASYERMLASCRRQGIGKIAITASMTGKLMGDPDAMLRAAAATRAGRSGQRLPDGAVVPACLEACPTGAIVFGDLNDPGSAVARLAAQPRAMRLLAAIGVEPSISYLTKVRNDKA